MHSPVSTRYARALADILLDPSSGVNPHEALEQLRQWAGLLRGQKEMRLAMFSPAVTVSAKKMVIGRLMGPLGGSPVIRNFLYVVVDHGRLGFLDEICDALEQELDGRTGAVKARIKTARPLSEAQQAKLRERLTEILGRTVRASWEVEEKLIGGALVQIGSTIYDGSVKGQLEALRQKLAEA